MSGDAEVHPRRNTLAFIGVLATLGALLTACGSQSIAGTYVARSSSKAAFLSLTENGAALSGTMDITQLPTGSSKVYTGIGEVTGTYANGRVTLTVTTNNETLSLSGTVQNGNLVFPAQEPNGTVGYTAYVRDSATTYNAAVDLLDERANANAATPP
jgi:hypothetical protein